MERGDAFSLFAFGGVLGISGAVNTRIFLIRHGATVLTAEDRFAGATDVALSDTGREQVRRLAERLSDEKITAVYASPLGRTVETASILAKPHGMKVETRDGLREISHGRWEQLTRKEVQAKFPEEAAAWDEDVVDVVRLYVAPRVLGADGVALLPEREFSSARLFERRVQPLGVDVMIEGYVHRPC